MRARHSLTDTARRLSIVVLAVVAGCGTSAGGSTAPASSPTPAPRIVSVTGHGLYERSETEFVFSADSGTYTVTMDASTRCVNLRGRLLGGYQIVSRLLMVTSLSLTVTGTLTGSTILAETVLVPTTKDALT